MLQKITSNGTELAIILRTSYVSDGISFFTPGSYSQQLGYINRPKGYVIPPHVHNRVVREVEYTNEVLFIKSGRVRVDFYDEGKKYLKSENIEKGDVLLLAHGGHGFEMLEPSEIIEVKQGPYAGDQDKTRFEPIGRDEILIEGEAQ